LKVHCNNSLDAISKFLVVSQASLEYPYLENES